MSNEIKGGTFKAKVLDYAISASKNGTPQACVLFKYKDDDGDTHDISWFGSFHENAKEYTVRDLVTLGFSGNDPSVLAQGVGNGALNTTEEIEIVVGFKEWNNKTYPEVRYINEPGGSKFRNKMELGEAKMKFNGMNLGAEFAEARQGRATPAPGKSGPNMAPKFGANEDPKFDANEDIPF